MSLIYLIRHPHTAVDLSMPAETWNLSAEGCRQLADLLQAPIWPHVTAIYPSQERKAIVPAKEVALRYRLNVIPRAAFGEVDRGACTPPDRAGYEAAVAAFFADPDGHPHGWEPASAVLERMLLEMDRVLSWHHADESIAIVGHGLALTVYMAHLRGVAPTLDDWRAIGFCTIATIRRETMGVLTGFIPAPYAGLPLP
jgi:broad specificity phosphatase PhoE